MFILFFKKKWVVKTCSDESSDKDWIVWTKYEWSVQSSQMINLLQATLHTLDTEQGVKAPKIMGALVETGHFSSTRSRQNWKHLFQYSVKIIKYKRRHLFECKVCGSIYCLVKEAALCWDAPGFRARWKGHPGLSRVQGPFTAYLIWSWFSIILFIFYEEI